MNSNYECIRCKHQTNKLYLMKNHLNKEKKCIPNGLEYLEYNDEEIYELSTTMINKRNNIKCEFCKKPYADKNSLNKHQKNTCKKINLNNNTGIHNNITNKSNNTNSFNITNIINHNHNHNHTNIININIPISFDKDWSIEHLDEYVKCLLLFTDNKYTKTLENILENKINLNVIFDKNEDSAIVFSENEYKNMNKKDLLEKSMEKIKNQLYKIKEDIELNCKKFENDYTTKEQVKIIDKKYKEYLDSDVIKERVNDYLSDIYDSNKKEAYEIYKEFINNKENGF